MARPPFPVLPVVAALLAAGGAAASPPGPALQPAARLALPVPADGRAAPIVLQADEVRGRPDLETVAEGRVELRRGPIVLRADRLSYDQPQDLAHARGQVRIEHAGDVFSGPELQLRLQSFEGHFLQPEYFFARPQAGGRAERIDFIDRQRAQAIEATYTSCLPDGTGAPQWLLRASRVKLDFEANEGVAEGAVLRFFDVPILAAPVLSFPLTDERKSGWLPPDIGMDNRSGFAVAVPYYWNIAPNRDATLTPLLMSRRGLGLEAEVRYLQPADRGEVQLHAVPHDRQAARSRHALRFFHEGDKAGLHYRAEGLRVSDDAHWKDFPGVLPTLTPRLLRQTLELERRALLGAQWSAYARAHHWQVLQDPAAPIEAPYQRSPQLGLRGEGDAAGGLRYRLEMEVNRFTRPSGALDVAQAAQTHPSGTRWHVLGTLSRPWSASWGWFEPRLTLNAARYDMDRPLADGRLGAARAIPTFSADTGLVFERDTRFLGRAVRQTLQPRLHYVRTPYRDQEALPRFDSAPKDFNEISIFEDNAFTGIDRVTDAHQVTAGATTRLIDADSGAELARASLAQRYLLREQRVTAQGQPLTGRVSDLLLAGASRLSPRWSFDAALQYRPDQGRFIRSVLGVRYSPRPWHTLAAGYRLAREPGESEQLDVGWQWPLYRADASRGGCGGTLYTVGKLDWSLRDRRLTDSLAGFEYDAGCWIARVVAERLSTGRTEARTRLHLQLELVGLSRLGSNPLRVLKDNIPGYRLLREERGPAADPPVYE